MQTSDPLGIQSYKAPKLKLRIARESDNKLGLGSIDSSSTGYKTIFIMI